MTVRTSIEFAHTLDRWSRISLNPLWDAGIHSSERLLITRPSRGAFPLLAVSIRERDFQERFFGVDVRASLQTAMFHKKPCDRRKMWTISGSTSYRFASLNRVDRTNIPAWETDCLRSHERFHNRKFYSFRLSKIMAAKQQDAAFQDGLACPNR